MGTPSDSTAPVQTLQDEDRNELLNAEIIPIHAQYVTILMSVAVTSEMVPGSPSRATNGFEAGDPTDNTAEDLAIANVGDQTPHVAVDDRAGDEAELPAELPVDDGAAVEEPRTVDLGWGIVVGDISREDFNEILSFPKLFDV